MPKECSELDIAPVWHMSDLVQLFCYQSVQTDAALAVKTFTKAKYFLVDQILTITE